jgi:hypothetical protein
MVKKERALLWICITCVFIHFTFSIFPLVLTSSSSHLLCLCNTFIIDPSMYICPCSWIVLIIPEKAAIIIFVIIILVTCAADSPSEETKNNSVYTNWLYGQERKGITVDMYHLCFHSFYVFYIPVGTHVF